MNTQQRETLRSVVCNNYGVTRWEAECLNDYELGLACGAVVAEREHKALTSDTITTAAIITRAVIAWVAICAIVLPFVYIFTH